MSTEKPWSLPGYKDITPQEWERAARGAAEEERRWLRDGERNIQYAPTPSTMADRAAVHAKAAAALADVAVLPLDVRTAAGLTTESVRSLYAAAKAEWQAAAAYLPPDVKANIEQTIPLPPRPATADSLLAKARLLGKVETPNILNVLDFAKHQAVFWTPAKERTVETAPEHDYEYARGTWAADMLEESVDVSSSELYIEAMREGRFAGEMLPGLELPGAMFGGRKTCGLPTVLGHVGDDDECGHRGKVVCTRGEMTCRSRPCNKCFDRWAAKEATKMADKLSAGLMRAHLAESGAPGGARVVVMHLAVSLPPSEKIAWASGPKERARIRKAVKAELERRGRMWGYSMSDHSYRFTENLESAYLSPHLHVFAIGWLDYRKNADRFKEFKDVPYAVHEVMVKGRGTGLDAQPTLATRITGRCRGMFVKHLSSLETYADIYQACYYVCTHGTASSRRLGETGGGEHATRWFGQLGNGKTKTESISRYERGAMAGEFHTTPLPEIIDRITLWRGQAGPDGLLSTVTPTHVFSGTGHDTCLAAFDSALIAEQRAHPATAKFERMLEHCAETPAGVDGPATVCLEEQPHNAAADGPPPEEPQDVYILAHVHGRVLTSKAYIPATKDGPARWMTPEEALRHGYTKEKSRWVVVRIHDRSTHLCPLCGVKMTQLVWDPGGTDTPMMPLNVSEGLGIVDMTPPDEMIDEAEMKPPARQWVVMDVRGEYEGNNEEDMRDFEWLTARNWMAITHTWRMPAWDGAGMLVQEDGQLDFPAHMDKLDVEVKRDITYDVLYSKVRAEFQKQKDEAYARGSWFHYSEADVKEKVADLFEQQATTSRNTRL